VPENLFRRRRPEHTWTDGSQGNADGGAAVSFGFKADGHTHSRKLHGLPASVLNVGSAAARCGPRYMNSYSNFAWCEHGFPRTCEEIGQGKAAFAARMPCLDFRPISYQGRDGVSRWRGTTDIANNCCPVP